MTDEPQDDPGQEPADLPVPNQSESESKIQNPKSKVPDEMASISRRGLIWAGAAVIGAYGGFQFLNGTGQEENLQWPFRRALAVNEGVWSELFRNSAMAPTFSPSERTFLKVNGVDGIEDGFDPSKWTLSVENVHGSIGSLLLTLDDIKSLPRHEFTTQLCCIEGWNSIVTWAGARFSDFAAKYLPPTKTGTSPDFKRPRDLVRYVYMETPGQHTYYVGLDMQSALHPQTLLCYEMNGKPLELAHGAPLRLVIPTKYGIKNIKRIGLIRYTDERPKDFWAERGYDWFAGL